MFEMLKTAQELKEQAKKIGLVFYPIHECSMCGYMCGFTFTASYERVGYDNGCDCTYGQNISERSWENLADTYNSNQKENNPKISQKYLDEVEAVWKFSS